MKNSITNRQIVCDELMKAARTDKDIVVLCSDSRGSASLTNFAKEFPQQFVEIGIAEQNLVSVSAGLASCGKRVFAASPASFLSTRSYEQVKVDVAYSKENVKLLGISGGVSYGALGMTHHSCQDIAAMSSLPDMRVYFPSDRILTARLMENLVKDDEPAYIRLSRGAVEDIYSEDMDFEMDKAKILSEGRDVAIIACGDLVPNAVEAANILRRNGIEATVVDMYCIKPLDENTVLEVANKCRLIVTCEEHSVYGGLGSLISRVLSEKNPVNMMCLALPDTHLVAGSRDDIYREYGLDGEGIAGKITERFRECTGK